MFQCHNCHRTTVLGEKQHKVPVELRTREKDGGQEVVKEISVCTTCWGNPTFPEPKTKTLYKPTGRYAWRTSKSDKNSLNAE